MSVEVQPFRDFIDQELSGPSAVHLDSLEFSLEQRRFAYRLFLVIFPYSGKKTVQTMGLARVKFTNQPDVAGDFHTFKPDQNLHHDLRVVSLWLEDELKRNQLVEGAIGEDLPLGVESAFWFKDDPESEARRWELLAAFAQVAGEMPDEVSKYQLIAKLKGLPHF